MLQERQALEKRIKLLELEFQHQAEAHVIQVQLAASRSRCQVLEVINDEENSQCLEDVYLERISTRSKRGDCVPLKQHEVRPKVADVLYQGQQLEQHENIKLEKVLIEMQKPQLEINTFGGDCITFKKFMRQFKCRVDGLCSDDERIAYLEQYTHKIVVGFLYLDAEVGYPATMAELRRRHGDPEVMANSYIKKVMSWPTIRADDPQALDEFAVFLKECEAATRCVGGLGVLESSENLKRILQKTPYFMASNAFGRMGQ
ncbi:hypothetical protein HOLleu_07928 [Holothuria leucospilota]|uniref:Uncharacterized protein n=1 Tax=Holothuria leucospilota TaxID=206669 RepID=A0A9Q1HD40_HOLLE|nr:hypothetical protein HOLleu_07928 [Holothuria leucospilota]